MLTSHPRGLTGVSKTGDPMGRGGAFSNNGYKDDAATLDHRRTFSKAKMNDDTKQTIPEVSEHVETIGGAVIGTSADTLVSTLLANDNVPWYRKPNLRKLYLLFIGSVLCIETTSGYDASVVNGLQAVPKWTACESATRQSLETQYH